MNHAEIGGTTDGSDLTSRAFESAALFGER